ncbi:MAG: RDD family protein [bacterium]|nr:RDD family protein [bacterium]
MVEFFILSQFVSAILTTLVGVGLILFIRKKAQKNIKEGNPAGFWMRAICFGTDLAIIDILASFLAFHGSLQASGSITLLLTLSYFFFFWLFFAATPAGMLAGIRIISNDNKPLKIWQVLVRLIMSVFLFVGWIFMFFDKKERKALHDIVSQTRVTYGEKVTKTDGGLIKKAKFIMLGMALVLLIGLIAYGLGEKLTKYAENDQVKFFDLDKDGQVDGLTMDLDKDGKTDVFKYDLDNDRVVDFTTFDTDKDGIAESIDMNNDGIIDGFDFDNDNKLDIKTSRGQRVIGRDVLFGIWAAGFAGLLIFAIMKEKKIIS